MTRPRCLGEEDSLGHASLCRSTVSVLRWLASLDSPSQGRFCTGCSLCMLCAFWREDIASALL